MSRLAIRSGAIRSVWIACFGNDPATGHLSAPDQHRVLCPIHSERSPSCDVHLVKNTWICRSCGASGGVLDLPIREGYAQNRSEAITWLTSQGVSVC